MSSYCITNFLLILIYSETHQTIEGTHSRAPSILITSAIFTVLTSVTPTPETDLLKVISENSPRTLYHHSLTQKQKNERTLTAKNFFTIHSKADKIAIYSIIGAMFLTAVANLGLFLATLFHYFFSEDKEEKSEKK
ncbi:Uncharacterized protein BM_BM17528 [Brugia malayi]|uniref:Uncharacterized protein n=2 Tax=Brugia TaxID=6278 RepID=A0A4E9FHY0_BRUMA|nr:Uncharacterized protein BM_BM17528 [Brugia malayi]VDO20597.1 unnamed protein product [Brugia timori]VIO94460.1 Uncharacterized protein BM_BM17528 [Brugia malayi]